MQTSKPLYKKVEMAKHSEINVGRSQTMMHLLTLIFRRATLDMQPDPKTKM